MVRRVNRAVLRGTSAPLSAGLSGAMSSVMTASSLTLTRT